MIFAEIPPMPIYAYRCEACGFAKDALQKVSDAPLTVCPSCSQSSFKKQLTAAGFQLKGSGWYVTDFRGGSGGAPKPAADSSEPAPAAAPAAAAPAAAATTSTATASDSGSSSASGTPAAATTGSAS
jgi:putative FmdB family regulatory protein